MVFYIDSVFLCSFESKSCIVVLLVKQYRRKSKIALKTVLRSQLPSLLLLPQNSPISSLMEMVKIMWSGSI